MNKNFTTLGYRPDFDTMTIILTKPISKQPGKPVWIARPLSMI